MMNLPSLRAANESLMTKSVHREMLTPELNQKNQACAKSASLLDEIGPDEEKIRADKKLSDMGKIEQLKKFGDASVPRVAFVGRTLNDARAAYARFTNILIGPITAIPDGVNEVVDFLRLQAIWEGIGKAGATVAFLKSLEDGGNLEIARALLSVPGQPWISDDIRRRGEEEYARRTNPEIFEKRQSVGHLRDNLEALANMISQWLLGLGADKELVAKTLNPK